MKALRSSILVALALLVSAAGYEAHGDPWRVHLERPIAPLGAPAEATALIVATNLVSNGIDVLAVWDDVLRFGSRTQYANVWGALIRGDGTLASETRIALGYGRAPQAIWTGLAWLVVWDDGGQIMLQPLSLDGVAIAGDPLLLKPFEPLTTVENVRVAWNGSRAVVAWTQRERSGPEEDVSIQATVLDATGTVIISPRRLTAATERHSLVDLAAIEREFLLLTAGFGLPVSTRTLTGELATGAPLPVPEIATPARLVSSGARVLAVWQERDPSLHGGLIFALELAADGRPAGAPRESIVDPGFDVDLTIDPVPGGSLLVYRASGYPDRPMHVLRLDERGRPLASLVVPAASRGSVAAMADGRIALLHRGEDRLPRLQWLDSTLLPLGEPFVVSFDAPAQKGGKMVAHPRGFLVVWGEELETGRVAVAEVIGHGGESESDAVVIGSGFPLAVTPAPGGFAVLLEDRSSDGRLSVVILDEEGRRTSEAVAAENVPAAVTASLAIRGDSALVVSHPEPGDEGWRLAIHLVDLRIGAAVNDLVIPLGEPVGELEAVATGSGWYIAWREVGWWPAIYGVALDETGVTVAPPIELVPAGLLPEDLDVATDGEIVLVAWLAHRLQVPMNDSIGIVSISPDGTVIRGGGGEPAIVTGGWNEKRLAGLWAAGDSYQLGWLERDGPNDSWKLTRARLDREGTLLDPLPHERLLEIATSPYAVTQFEWSRGRIGILSVDGDPYGGRPERLWIRITGPVRSRPTIRR